MRTFTVVPSFEGNSAFFELPDIGFQGDHLSFAILFNLTELTEHWPNIVPSMIVTDPKSNTFIASHTSWNPNEHIFTWLISEVETAYDGIVKCQLKCTSADDPEDIVCMSQICQTRVYQSLAAAENPPEAFQTWLDTLVQLGAEITANTNIVIEGVSASETNARTAQTAAEEAATDRDAVTEMKATVLQSTQTAVSARDDALAAQQRAQNAATASEASKTAAQAAQSAAEAALAAADQDLVTVQSLAQEVSSALDQSTTNAQTAVSARNDAIAAKEAAEVAKGRAEADRARAEAAEASATIAKVAAEDAQVAAEAAQTDAETAEANARAAQTAAETAQSNAEAAQTAAETAQAIAEDSEDMAKKWAIGVGVDGNPVGQLDPTYNNHAKHWAETAEAARDAILSASLSSVVYTPEDESITLILGGDNIIHNG